EQGLDRLLALADESIDFSRFLRSPVINTEEKAMAMGALLERAKPHTTVGNFVRVVARNGRLFALPAIVAAFKERAAGHRGEVTAEVTSAVPLTAAQVATLADTLKAMFVQAAPAIRPVFCSLCGGYGL